MSGAVYLQQYQEEQQEHNNPSTKTHSTMNFGGFNLGQLKDLGAKVTPLAQQARQCT